VEHVIEEFGMGIWSWLFGPSRQHDEKVDKAVDMTFPASDPVATGQATSTEPPKRPTDRQPPLISKEEIDQARRGSGHERN
jgi:hypothetical protein